MVAVLAAGAALLCVHLGTTPQYLGGDEASFGIEGYAIATTGRDLVGGRLPLFFHLADPAGGVLKSSRWYQPLLFYLVAGTLKLFPLTEATVRAPTAFIGVTDLWLIYVVASRLFHECRYGILAAAMLLVTPAHVILSRQATDYLCVLPFVLAWLWSVIAAVDTDRGWASLLAGVVLGIGLFSYLAAWTLMPMLLLLTSVTFAVRGKWTHAAAAVAGFTAFAAVLIAWLFSHPQMLTDTFGRYQLATSAGGTVGRILKELLVFRDGRNPISTYWAYFDPAFLFVSGGVSPTTATSKAGVYLASLAILIPIGAYHLISGGTSSARLAVAAFLLAPIPAALVGDRYMIQRTLAIVPLGVLLATGGAEWLLRHRCRVVLAALVAAMLLQFSWFIHDYFGHYRFRSAAYFDSANFREVVRAAIVADAEQQAPVIYLSERFDDGSPRWRFYTTAYRRGDLFLRTHFLDALGANLDEAPAGSLLLFYDNAPGLDQLLASGWTIVSTIAEPSGGARSLVLRKS
jgi:4-amino-4-deoxy-L-arabinose transferase-like glycosyltransferase